MYDFLLDTTYNKFLLAINAVCTWFLNNIFSEYFKKINKIIYFALQLKKFFKNEDIAFI